MVVDKTPLDTARDIVIGAVEFRHPGEESGNLPWLTIELVPIKDTEARRREAVMPVRRRSHGELGTDPMCTYDAIVRAVHARTGTMPPTYGRVTGPVSLMPLFVGPSGQPWTTTDSRLKYPASQGCGVSSLTVLPSRVVEPASQ